MEHLTGTIQVAGLRKRYGRVAALDGLDLTVAEGNVVGLLGPNGAGKTTALRILVGLVRADAGSVAIEGRLVDRSWVAGQRVGALIALPVFYPHLSGRDNLRVVGATWAWPKGRIDDRIASVLRQVDLASVGTRSVKGYSTGMRQRLGIAQALLADPPIIILDEPVNGLDPAGIVEIRDLLTSLAGSGRTILVSSHLLTEVEKTCDHVAIMDRGRILAEGTPDALSGVGTDRVEVQLDPADLAAAQRVLDAAGLRVSNDPAALLRVGGAAGGAQVARLLAGAGVFPEGLVHRRDSLEDVFLRLTDHRDEPVQ
ncbi:MAG: ABC transporter ATP-binding protein [Candidatus Limnocylindrales bacterium]